jgi:hypothetical protein
LLSGRVAGQHGGDNVGRREKGGGLQPGEDGAQADRPGLEAALHDLREGDTLVVWKLDRLGRSLKHLIETVQGFWAKSRKIAR